MSTPARTLNPSRLPVRWRAFIVLITLGLLGTIHLAPLFAQHSPTLIRGASVFDGERVLGTRDILIEDGRIIELGAQLDVPAGAEVIDATGQTLLPGLIDAHTHTFGDGLTEALIFGVTTQLDMLTDPAHATRLRSEQESAPVTDRADLYSAGALVTAPGGHGTQFGISIPTLASPESAQAFVDARLAEGSDWIKIVLDDFRAYGMSMPTLDARTVEAVIDATRRRDRLAVVHIGDASAARTAIEAGAHGLAHLFTDRMPEDDFASLVASRDAFVIPTLSVLMSIAGTPGGASLLDDERLSAYLHPDSRTMLRNAFPEAGPSRSYDIARETTRQLHAAGVPVLAGTDAPNPGTAYGSAMHRELELLVDAGLSPTEALAAATSAPARIFGLEDRGRIEPGLRADLLLVDGDPTVDITMTRAIAGVWKAGTRVDREAYAARISAALETADPAPAITDLVDGLISDFESGELEAAAGSWIESPDTYAGGNSTGSVEVVEGGTNSSGHALSIAGTIGDAVPFAWYGVMWMPDAQAMTPVDLSSYSGLSFWTRGDGGTYRLMIFAQSHGMEPIARTFETSEEWDQITFEWDDFEIDGSDVMGVVLTGGPQPGPFSFLIDEFRLER